MKKFTKTTPLALGLFLATAHGAMAQSGLGARELGMGGAFTAVAEGDGAALWNPAAVANQHGYRFLMPNITLLSSGSVSGSAALKGFSSHWDDQLQFARGLAGGPTHIAANAYGGFAARDMSFGLQLFGKGSIEPTDGNGTSGHITLTKNFSISDFQNAAVKQYMELGDDHATALRDAAKIVSQIQGSRNGINQLALPTYNSRLSGSADVYGSGFVTLAHKVRPNFSIGLNLKIISAVHVDAYAHFNKSLTDKAAQATGGTASPALIDRVLMKLGLQRPDGQFFSGGELAGDVTTGSVTSGLEVRPSADLGALWRVDRRLQTGLVIRNLLPAHFNSAAALDTYVDAGVAYVVSPQRLLVTADMTNFLDSSATRLNFGMEWRPFPLAALRAGLYHGRLTYGIGLGNGLNLAASQGMSMVSIGIGF